MILIVIPLPLAIRKALQRLCCGLANVSWIDESDFSLELMKFENKYEGKLADIVEQLNEIDQPPFPVLLQGVRTQTKKGNGALWIGVEENRSLNSLTKAIAKSLSPLKIQALPSTPHVVIGHYRSLSSERLALYLEGASLFESPRFNAENFALMTTHATPKRTLFTLHHRFPLRS